MMELCMKVIDGGGNTKAVARGTGEVSLAYSHAYEEGDRIALEISQQEGYVWLQVDDALGKSLVYLTGNTFYLIPFGEKRINLSPKAFSGIRHLLSAREAKEFEISAYRNLAVNVCDQHTLENCYPHAKANVETRGESVFAAQNAIDGVTINESHGEWPYQSWGINRQKDARIRVDFGREVEADRIILYTRADFPHDSWWEKVSFTFSDGSSLTMEMKKSERPHEIKFEKRRISWVEMHDMIQAQDPSPFPALTQIEIYGSDIR